MLANNEDNLSAFERRLSEWRPAVDGLDSDAMLFQAGLQAGRHTRGRSLWPAMCFVLAAACVGFFAWGLVELAPEHQALAGRLHEQIVAKHHLPLEAAIIPTLYIPTANDYFQLRRGAEQDLGRWFASVQTSDAQPIKQPAIPDILRAGQVDRFRDQ